MASRSHEAESPRATRCILEQSSELGTAAAALGNDAMPTQGAIGAIAASSLPPLSPAAPPPHKSSSELELESEKQRQHRTKRLRSWYAHMALIALAEFSAEAARGLVLPTLFTYSQELGGDIVFMGLLTSLFSLGRFVASLLFGWLSDRLSFRALYNIAGAISVVGNVLYILPFAPTIRSRALLGFSRCVVGFGAGNRSVCRANIAHLTPVDQRLACFTLFATVVFLAYALTPGLGGVFGTIDVDVTGELLQLNRFTAPGFVLVVLNVVTLAVNNIVFDASITRDDAPRSATATATASSMTSKTELGEVSADKSELSTHSTAVAADTALSERMVALGAMVFVFLNFNTRGMLSVFETVNVPLFLAVTHRTSSVEAEESLAATKDASSFYFVVGLLGLVSYAALQLLGRRVSDVAFLLFGFVTLLVGNALLVWLCALLAKPSAASANHFDLFVIAEVLVWSIGCPLTSAVVVSAFSKVLGTRPQGMLMGIFGSSASIARMLMPFLPGLLPSWQALFGVHVALCTTCVAVLVAYLQLARHARSSAYESVANPVATPALPPALLSPTHATARAAAAAAH